MKTTVNFEDAVYKMVVTEAIDLYGSARNVSLVVNKYLKEAFLAKRKKQPSEWMKLWGVLKTDIPTQKLKDMAREGWGP